MMAKLLIDSGDQRGVRAPETSQKKQSAYIFLFLLLVVHAPSHAGSLVNDAWSPSGCGEKPEAPIVDSTSAEQYNRSVDAINDWQDRAVKYLSCLVNEANADSKLITDTANDIQAKFQEEIDRVITEADNAKTGLEER